MSQIQITIYISVIYLIDIPASATPITPRSDAGGSTPIDAGGGTPIAGGGTPIAGGGTPIAGGGTPIAGGGTPIDVGGGTPIAVGGTPIDVGGGTPIAVGGGTPIDVGGGTPIDVGGGTPIGGEIISPIPKAIATESNSPSPSAEPNVEFSNGNSLARNPLSLASSICSRKDVNCPTKPSAPKQTIGPRSRVLLR